MLSTQSLREQMDRYASGDLAAEALEVWLAAESWDIRRWAPKGLQHFVEAIQVIFIDFADGRISNGELHDFLLLRRNQLQRAQEATEQTRQLLATDKIQELTASVSEAIMVKASAVVAA